MRIVIDTNTRPHQTSEEIRCFPESAVVVCTNS